jgi:hypothetical protein
MSAGSNLFVEISILTQLRFPDVAFLEMLIRLLLFMIPHKTGWHFAEQRNYPMGIFASILADNILLGLIIIGVNRNPLQ